MKRDKVIHIRLSEEELELIKKKAESMGLNDSAYVRMLLVTNSK